MYEIDTTPPTLSEPNCYLSGDFNLDSYVQTESTAGNITLLFFINIENSPAAQSWLTLLDDVGTASGISPVAAFFRHDGAYQNVTNNDLINPIISNSGLMGNEFEYCRIEDKNYAQFWLEGITGDTDDYGDTGAPAGGFWNNGITGSPEMFAYIFDTRGRASDKWHNQRTDDPLAVALCVPEGESFPGGSITGWAGNEATILADAIETRCLNLRSELKILSGLVSPATNANVTTAPGPVTIPFSRPLDDTIASDTASWELDGTALSAGAGAADSVNHDGRNFIENTVSLNYTAVTLDDSGGWTMTLSFPNLRDAASGAPETDNDEISWTVSTSRPSIETTAVTTNPHSGNTVGAAPIRVDFTFSEPIPALATDLVSVTANPVGSNNPIDIQFHHTADSASGYLTFGVTNAASDGNYNLAIESTKVEDGAGESMAANWTGTVIYDHAPPQPAITSEDINSGDSSGLHNLSIAMSFPESVNPVETNMLPGGITVTNGSIEHTGTAAGVYHYRVKPSAAGNVSVQVASGAAKDIPLGRNTPASAVFSFIYTPVYRDIVVLVDESGSMGWDIPFNPGTGTVNTGKWTIMRPRIKTFLAKIAAAIGTGTAHPTEDKLSLITYSSSAGVVSLAGSDWISPVNVGEDSPPGPFELALNAIIPDDTTAMGSAIKTAYDLLDARTGASGREAAIILFADGQDNDGLGITVTEGDRFVIGDPAVLTVLNGSDNYPIYTIGIETELAFADSWLTDLQNIAAISGGFYRPVTEVELFDETEGALTDVITAVYGSNTSVLITAISGVIPSGQSDMAVPFDLGDGVAGLEIAVAWPGTDKASLRVVNDGHVLRGYESHLSSSQHEIAAIRFPHIQRVRAPKAVSFPENNGGRVLNRYALNTHTRPHRTLPRVFGPGGGWAVVISRIGLADKGDLPFHLTVLAEEKETVPKLIIPDAPYLTDKSFNPEIRIPGERIRIDTAVMRLSYCEVSKANLLYAMAGTLPALKPVVFHPDIKFGPNFKIERVRKIGLGENMKSRHKEFMRINSVKKALGVRKQIHYAASSFHTDAEGTTCSWKLSGFPVPGNYNMEFIIKGRGKGIGSFERTIRRTVLVLPGINPQRSILSYKLNPKNRWFEARVVPQDSLGNLLGPGYAETLNVYAHIPGSLSVTDHHDGSYTVKGRARLFPPKPLPKMCLRLSGGFS